MLERILSSPRQSMASQTMHSLKPVSRTLIPDRSQTLLPLHSTVDALELLEKAYPGGQMSTLLIVSLVHPYMPPACFAIAAVLFAACLVLIYSPIRSRRVVYGPLR